MSFKWLRVGNKCFGVCEIRPNLIDHLWSWGHKSISITELAAWFEQHNFVMWTRYIVYSSGVVYISVGYLDNYKWKAKTAYFKIPKEDFLTFFATYDINRQDVVPRGRCRREMDRNYSRSISWQKYGF